MVNSKNYPLYKVTKFSTIKELLEIAVKEDGNKIAFKYKKGDDVVDVTYSEFQNDTFSLGTALFDLNMADKHVAVIGENSYNWITVYLTMLKSEGVVVPIDKELPTLDIINILNSSNSNVLFYARRYEEELMKNVDKLSNIKYFIGFGRAKDEGKFLSYKNFIKRGKELYEKGETGYINMKGNENDLRMLVYTSGTTGLAKGVMLSEHNLVNSVFWGVSVSTVYTRSLSVLPYHHTYEAVSGLLVSMHKHATICINDNLKAVLKNLQLFKPDFIYLVPAFVEVFYKKIWSNAKQGGKEKALHTLIKVSNKLRKCGIDLRKILFSSIHKAFGGKLRKIVSGGAPIRAELGDFFDAIGIDLINGYGITECSPLVSANRDKFNDCATVGMVLPCCEIKFEGLNDNGEGEICVKGDVVMLGYYNDIERTREVLSEDGWFKTGDYGKFNDKGQLMITGRKKNLIVLDNGKNVFPEEIENYILSIPYVKEVVVYGLKNDIGQEYGLCAELFFDEEAVKTGNIENPNEKVREDINKICEILPVYKHISKIVVRDKEFEKTTSNKIKRANIGK